MNTAKNKTIAVSIDLDPIDHYLSCRGFSPLAETNLNAVYDEGIPGFISLFEEYDIKATFFVVGKDALIEKNSELIRLLHNSGHEIANHSMDHRLDLYKLNKDELRKQIVSADTILSEIIQEPLAGFRAPGWNISPAIFDVLEELDYKYDSSVMPGPWIPFYRAANNILNRGTTPENFREQKTFPPAPDQPYFPGQYQLWKKGNRSVLEIPCGVSPGLRIPFYGTARITLGETVHNLAVATSGGKNKKMVYVFHGIELVDFETQIKDPRLRVKSGITWPLKRKIETARQTIESLKTNFNICRIKDITD
ncbi:MAG TPA: polysaccharide deacetylase family protein [bacterium]|nr:polysaccharide deacetylase family protein [bacterium]